MIEPILFISLIVGLLFYGISRLNYVIDEQYLRVRLGPIPLRKVAIDDIADVRRGSSHWSESWTNTIYPPTISRRGVTVYRKTGGFKRVVLTPDDPGVFIERIKDASPVRAGRGVGGIMKIWIGKVILAIGLVHSVVGFIFFRGILGELWSEMLLNTVDRQPDREAAFWFIYTGFAFLIIGGLVDWIERKQPALPVFLKWSFLAITLAGLIIMPKSGFWLLIFPTVGLFVRAKQEA